MRRSRREPADEIEGEESPWSHAVFDVVAEHPEEERVTEDVSPAAVQKHRRQRRPLVDGVVVYDAGKAASDWHSCPERRAMGELAGHHAEVTDARGELDLLEAGALDDEKNGEHRREQRPRH